MTSLVNHLYFVPNRLVVKKNKMYVYFQLDVIPSDINVRKLIMHIPVQSSQQASCTVLMKKITESWSEKKLLAGNKPARHKYEKKVWCSIQNNEVTVDLTRYSRRWRFKGKRNHGLYLKIIKPVGVLIDPFSPPYLDCYTDELTR